MSVSPLMNQRSSSTIPRKKTLFVVNRGSLLSLRENLNCPGEKIERVPVPVLSLLCSPILMIFFIRSKYWYSSCLFSVSIFVFLTALLYDLIYRLFLYNIKNYIKIRYQSHLSDFKHAASWSQIGGTCYFLYQRW